MLKWTKIGLIALGCSAVLVACTQSPTGRNQLMLYSSGQLASLGDDSYAQLKSKEKISTDAATNAYVRCITDDLISVLPTPWRDKQWEVTVFDSEQVNAFALPGENIGVYTGLLKVTENRDQLAAVIGHEIAHVIADHGNERMSNQMAVGLGLQVGSVIAATQLEDDTAAIVMAALGIGAQVGVLLPYSRVHESESDQLGMDYMAAAGYNPAQAANLWRNMAQVGGASGPEFLSTHPSPQSRIQAIEAYAPKLQTIYQEARANRRKPLCSM
ncbi:M48 family metallopeptidase [Pseudidiomarina gelatinasegens]|jgi:predicted Zn-dependent protease|uniref:M48 family metallopeptidase n=1 Tax=Pseudidiomarina gelatinasegens TaxID=2487740 RepID=UPI0030EC7C88